MRNRVFKWTAMIATSAFLMTACSGNAEDGNQSSGETPSWDLQAALPASHWWAETHELFAETLAERGGEAPQITVHPGGSLGIPPADVFEYVADGRADIVEAVAAYTAGSFPEMTLFDQQMLMPDHAAAVRAWEILATDIEEVIEERFNAKVLYAGPSDAQIIFSSSPLETLDDLSGKVLRAASQSQIELVNGIPGASATVLPSADVYSALERGVIDGNLTSTANTLANSWNEVTKHGLIAPLSFSLIVTVINLETWNSLSADAQSALEEASSVAQEQWFARGAEVSIEAQEELEGMGVSFVDASEDVTRDLRNITVPQWDAWAESTSPLAVEWLAKLRDAGFPESVQ